MKSRIQLLFASYLSLPILLAVEFGVAKAPLAGSARRLALVPA